MAEEKICVAHVCATTFFSYSLSRRLRHLIDFTSNDIQIEFIDVIHNIQVHKLHRDRYPKLFLRAFTLGLKDSW